MPLNATTLASEIKAAILAEPDAGAVDGAALEALSRAIASAVVTHVTVNALVLPTLMVAPPTGGPVTGTGVVT